MGTSETIGHFSNLFSAKDRKHKIFIRKSGIAAQRLRVDFTRTDLDHLIADKSKSTNLDKTSPIKLADLTEKTLLRNYAPSCVVVDDKNNALYFYGDTGKFLQPTAGEPSFNVLDMARMGLRASLRIALNKSRKSKIETNIADVTVKTNGAYETINLRVKPITPTETSEQVLMVIFEEIPASEKKALKPKMIVKEDKTEIIELEHELASTKEYLRTTIEELEISNEELKSANEELQSANEELQSTNEELETSKEELQSVNEEMITVNSELQNKIFELAHAHDDMENLLASTEIGTIFLGSNLEIRRFTPAISKVINLIQTDIGRSIGDLSSNLINKSLTQEARTVLKTLIAKKMVVQTANKKWYHLQITPYRTTDNVIDGVVMTFVDISEEKGLESNLAKSNEHLTLALETLTAVPFTCKYKDSKNIEFIFVGNSVEKVMGFSSERFSSSSDFWFKRIHREDKKSVLEHFENLENNGIKNFDFRWKCSNGRFKKFRTHAKLIKFPKKQNEDYITGIWQDVSSLL